MTYEEYLKSLGATDEDLKLLNNAVARKAWETQQAAITAAETKAAKATADKETYQKWYDEQALPAYTKMEKEKNTAVAEAAAAAARVKALQEQGLLEIDEAAKAAEAARLAAASQPAAFDPAKYNLVTGDILTQVAEREGDAIAIAQDIAFEHRQLFPDKPLNFRELRKEAVAQKKSVESLWMEKFGVAAARESRAAADKAAYEKQIADAAIAKYRSEHSTTHPGMALGVPSSNPFTGKVPSASDAVQPWLRSDTEKVNARVAKIQSAHPELIN